jgi:hypothetical protein
LAWDRHNHVAISIQVLACVPNLDMDCYRHMFVSVPSHDRDLTMWRYQSRSWLETDTNM